MLYCVLIPAHFFQEKEKGRNCIYIWRFPTIWSLSKTAAQQMHTPTYPANLALFSFPSPVTQVCAVHEHHGVTAD